MGFYHYKTKYATLNTDRLKIEQHKIKLNMGIKNHRTKISPKPKQYKFYLGS